MITEIDRRLILRQCELQGATSPEEVADFTSAYGWAKGFAESFDLATLTKEEVLSLAQDLGFRTIPSTGGRYRSVPVTFASGDSGLNPQEIPRVMENWAEAYAEGHLRPVDLYREFELIHPFVDGNGRVGDLLWKIAKKRKTGLWPQDLPPDFFGLGANRNQKHESSFGEVVS